MNFDSKKIMKGDPLWSSFFLCIGILQYKPIRLIFEASFLICFIIFVIELHALQSNLSYCIKYGPWMTVKQFGFLSLLAVFRERKHIEGMWQYLNRWSLDSAGPVLKKKLTEKARQHNTGLIRLGVLISVYAILILLPNPSDNELYLIQMIVEQKYLKYATIFKIFGKVIHAPICWGMLMMPLTFVYAEQHCVYQSMMFVEHAENLSWEFENFNEAELLNDAEYQKLIHERLEFCIKRHIDFIKFLNQFSLPLLRRWFPWFVISGTLVGIGLGMLIYAVYYEILQHTLHNVAIVIAINAVVLIIFSRMINSGQTIENESEGFLISFMETRWLSWNKSNRMMLVLMVQNSKPMQLAYVENLAINNQLAIRMARGIYSVISLFTSIRSSGH